MVIVLVVCCPPEEVAFSVTVKGEQTMEDETVIFLVELSQVTLTPEGALVAISCHPVALLQLYAPEILAVPVVV